MKYVYATLRVILGFVIWFLGGMISVLITETTIGRVPNSINGIIFFAGGFLVLLFCWWLKNKFGTSPPAPKFCPNCDTENSAEARFCTSCGQER